MTPAIPAPHGSNRPAPQAWRRAGSVTDLSTASSTDLSTALSAGLSAECVRIAPPSTTDLSSQVVVQPTHALLTRLELEVARGLGTAVDSSRILGTSVVGVVASIGSNWLASRAGDSAGLSVGSRVVVQPVHSCGACVRCTQGLALHCVRRTILGIDHAFGALAETIVVDALACTPLPSKLSEERAVFAVTLARAIEAVRRGGIAERSFVSVLGDDALAVLTTLVALESNPQARLVATHPATLKVAEQFAIPHRALHEIGRRGDQEVVIDANGSVESLEAAMQMVRPKGVVVSAGLSARTTVEVDLSLLALDEIEILGSGFGPLVGALDRLSRGIVDPSPLVSRRVGFRDVSKALPLLADPSVQSVLVQVDR
ncbi:MAG: alcohol dehydrogenase catalytic domain-containing protein [Limnohabitans sp.]|jgi:threonine dehydrogenase-like Zn-dependent dehydrogenase|nr:alcohol dehydrogenase catalytic domain-containing protein [Limnohabitans sp.]